MKSPIAKIIPRKILFPRKFEQSNELGTDSSSRKNYRFVVTFLPLFGHCYEKLLEDPKRGYADDVLKGVDEMKSSDLITEKARKFITADLDNQQSPIFYGLPKVHENWKRCPQNIALSKPTNIFT